MQQMLTTGVLALAGLAACFAQPQRTPEYRLSGPYTHNNLTIFLIHGAGKTNNTLLTLDEAIDQPKVVVYETRNVNELAVENVSDQDVFIESGDIVKGGAQDRTLKDDLILPSKSGKVSLGSFCVEHGRWTRRGSEDVSTFADAHQALASKQLKIAVKMKNDQQEVWSQVARAQAQLSSNLRTDVRSAASPSSFAMTLAVPAVQRSIDGFLQDLAGIVNGKNDVIGYAFAIDGKLNSADVYASHDLFAKLWMKLLRASSVEAVSAPSPGQKPEPVTAAVVKAAIADAESGRASGKNLTGRTELVVKETAQNILFETRDRAQRDAWVHRNYLTK
jgi:hypothetical protein